jgi:methionyl-tRNA synthetase
LESGRWSHNAKAITNDWLDNLISERSISRDLKWGVPVPKKGY